MECVETSNMSSEQALNAILALIDKDRKELVELFNKLEFVVKKTQIFIAPYDLEALKEKEEI